MLGAEEFRRHASLNSNLPEDGNVKKSQIELTNNSKDFDMICEFTVAKDKDLTESEIKEPSNSESNVFVNEASQLESCNQGANLADLMD